MLYSVSVLAYPVSVSTKLSLYVLELFWCLSALQHRIFQPAVGRNGPHKVLGLG